MSARESPQLLTWANVCWAPCGVLSILPKIPEISVGIRFGFFCPEYSRSPLEVVHIFQSEHSDRNSPFYCWQTGSLPLLGNSVTKFKMTRAISISWPDLIGKCCSIFLRYSHWSLTGHFGIMESTPFFLRGFRYQSRLLQTRRSISVRWAQEKTSQWYPGYLKKPGGKCQGWRMVKSETRRDAETLVWKSETETWKL